MYTAIEFLQAGRDGYIRLAEELTVNPAHLQGEFVAVAIDPSQPIKFRTKSLRMLCLHEDILRTSKSSAAVGLLLDAFAATFPLTKLTEIRDSLKREESHYEAWLMYMFAITIERVACDSGKRQVQLAYEVLADTALGPNFARYVDRIRKRRM